MNNKLEKYIRFILISAMQFSHGDSIVIWCSKQQSDFAQAVQNYAMKIGADDAEIYYTDELSDANTYADKISYWKSRHYKLLWIYSDNCTRFPPLSWTAVNVATESWAKQIFPEIDDSSTAVEKLWEAIFTACRIDDKDPVENWKKRIDSLNDKAAKLNYYNFKKLIIKNHAGTNLSVKLIKNHRWINCTAKNSMGKTIITNIPTEEVFTTPDANGINGIVYATKPLLYNGEKIENFYLQFENGKILNFGAEKNVNLLKELLFSCKNADRIGEIAIVPHSSPVSQLGLFWYDTSFDENAGCHLALGAAYPQTLQNYSETDSSLLDSSGFNVSEIHEDFVIGSADMEITGITADGKTVIILRNGEWSI